LCIKRQIVEGRGGNWPQDLHIYESDIQVIKIQMAAYGFMTIYSAQVVNGGLEEFMQLTDFGKRTLVETAAVKSSHATS
jgi:hypothetical protein